MQTKILRQLHSDLSCLINHITICHELEDELNVSRYSFLETDIKMHDRFFFK